MTFVKGRLHEIYMVEQFCKKLFPPGTPQGVDVRVVWRSHITV